MRDFIAEIKRINTDGVIFELSKASIEMFRDQQYRKPFEIKLNKFGIKKTVCVSLNAWDIQDIAYLSVIYSNDYRRNDHLPTMGNLVNLYRGYENINSIAGELHRSNIDRIFRAILGMTAEQFQYQNISWIFEKFNRDYYILLAAKEFEHRPLLDVNAVTKELLGFSADEYIMVLLMVFGLSRLDPIPLRWYARLEAAELPTIISRENIEKIIGYYRCTYEDLRNSPLGKQLLYSKPFIQTQREQLLISCNMYLVAMLIGNGLYWLTRDYYRKQKQDFPNTFGLLFEDYVKDLASKYCERDQWSIISQGKKKGADFFFDIGSIRIIVEAKSALLQLSARQQVPDLDAVDTFFQRNINESYKQLNNSFKEMASTTTQQIIKVTLLYDDFSNTSIIEQSIPDIYTDDPCCYIMTIRELEILLHTHKHDKEKRDAICDRIVANTKEAGKRESIGTILEKMDLIINPHLEGEMDFFTKITEQLQEKLECSKNNNNP